MGIREKLTLAWRNFGPKVAVVDDFIEVASKPIESRAIEVRTLSVQPFSIWDKPSGLEICMECWVYYMHIDNHHLAASQAKLRMLDDEELEHTGFESDPNDEQHKYDIKVGEATNAMINSLKIRHLWAVHKKYGIRKVWDFPNLDFGETLAEAINELEKKLRANVVTRTKFD